MLSLVKNAASVINEYGTLSLYGASSCFQAMAFMTAGVLKQSSFYGSQHVSLTLNP
jgi:hypothetical protein